MITIRPLTDATALNELVAAQPGAPFLQSWAWGEFQHGVGRTIWRLGAYDADRLVGAALVIQHELMLGKSYLYCPRGPIAASPDAFRALAQKTVEVGKECGAMFVKVEPGVYDFPLDEGVFPSDYQPGSALQPHATIILNLDGEEDSWLSAMHQKTRYNIRLAEKKGVTVRWSTSDEDINIFLTLMHATAERQKIRLHPDAYYRTMIRTLGDAGIAEIAIAEFAGAPLAAHFVVWNGPMATYLHGGSSDEQKEFMAPYLVQWETMKRAKAKGCSEYDLWGVAPAGATGHRWSGITRFKEGFGGTRVEYPLAANAILDRPWYQAYRTMKRLRGGVDE